MINLRNIWLIPLTLAGAIFLSQLPLPSWINPFRPDWIMLCTIAWGILLPRVMGIFLPWTVGIVADVMIGSIIGAHALAYVIAGYFTLSEHQRLRVNPVGQQMVFVGALLFCKQVILMIINGAIGYRPEDLVTYFMPSLVGMFLWPICFQFIRGLTQRHHLN